MGSEVWSVWFLIGAALVFFMQCGFAMVETGFTRAPCIPIGTYRVHRRFRDAEYDLIIRNAGKGGKVFIPYKPGKQTLEVDC